MAKNQPRLGGGTNMEDTIESEKEIVKVFENTAAFLQDHAYIDAAVYPDFSELGDTIESEKEKVQVFENTITSLQDHTDMNATVTLDLNKLPSKVQRLVSFLKDLEIESTIKEFKRNTVMENQTANEESPLNDNIIYCKNLFLKDRKCQFYLIVLHEESLLDLKYLKQEVKAARNLSFADENSLLKILEVKSGAVSPLALFKDSATDVKVFIEDSLIEIDEDKTRLAFHPLEHNLQIDLSFEELKIFLTACGYTLNVFKNMKHKLHLDSDYRFTNLNDNSCKMGSASQIKKRHLKNTEVDIDKECDKLENETNVNITEKNETEIFTVKYSIQESDQYTSVRPKEKNEVKLNSIQKSKKNMYEDFHISFKEESDLKFTLSQNLHSEYKLEDFEVDKKENENKDNSHQYSDLQFRHKTTTENCFGVEEESIKLEKTFKSLFDLKPSSLSPEINEFYKMIRYNGIPFVEVDVSTSSNEVGPAIGCRCFLLKDRRDNYFFVISHEFYELDFGRLKQALKPKKKLDQCNEEEILTILKVDPSKMSPFCILNRNIQNVSIFITEKILNSKIRLCMQHPFARNYRIVLSSGNLQKLFGKHGIIFKTVQEKIWASRYNFVFSQFDNLDINFLSLESNQTELLFDTIDYQTPDTSSTTRQTTNTRSIVDKTKSNIIYVLYNFMKQIFYKKDYIFNDIRNNEGTSVDVGIEIAKFKPKLPAGKDITQSIKQNINVKSDLETTLNKQPMTFDNLEERPKLTEGKDNFQNIHPNINVRTDLKTNPEKLSTFFIIDLSEKGEKSIENNQISNNDLRQRNILETNTIKTDDIIIHLLTNGMKFEKKISFNPLMKDSGVVVNESRIDRKSLLMKSNQDIQEKVTKTKTFDMDSKELSGKANDFLNTDKDYTSVAAADYDQDVDTDEFYEKEEDDIEICRVTILRDEQNIFYIVIGGQNDILSKRKLKRRFQISNRLDYCTLSNQNLFQSPFLISTTMEKNNDENCLFKEELLDKELDVNKSQNIDSLTKAKINLSILKDVEKINDDRIKRLEIITILTSSIYIDPDSKLKFFIDQSGTNIVMTSQEYERYCQLNNIEVWYIP